jgi:uncharacterized cupredoxin-like copper-binding protein
MRRAWVVAVAGLLVLTGCGADDSGGGTAAGATVQEYKVVPTPDQAPVGRTTFEVTNKGKTTHEFVVFKTDLAPDELPVKDDAVEEDGPGVTLVDEIKAIEPGTTKKLTVELEPGKYVLICNLPTHYGLGMHAAFTVS